jgi:hypothetical protein
MEAIPLTNTAATDVAAALFSGWISRFGVPDTITSDRGPQFTSNIWNSLCLLLQIKHRPTTAYHPQANGMVERLHRHLKDALRTRGANAAWAAELPWVLLGLCSQPREDSNISPAQAVYGTPLVLPNQFLSIDDTVTMNEFLVQINNILNNSSLPRHNVAADRELPKDLPPDLWAADRVWVRRCGHVPPLTPLYDGPYAVIQRCLRAFKLQIGGKEDQVSTSRLKPCSSSTPTASRRPTNAPGGTPPVTRRRQPASADGSASTSAPNQRLQTLELFFLHSLAGFLNAQSRRPRAATPADNAGRPQVSRTTASFSLIATKKLEGPMWRAAHLCGQLPTNSVHIDV